MKIGVKLILISYCTNNKGVIGTSAPEGYAALTIILSRG
jgi:hypothetical protein